MLYTIFVYMQIIIYIILSYQDFSKYYKLYDPRTGGAGHHMTFNKSQYQELPHTNLNKDL
jgi:hypothetical protein